MATNSNAIKSEVLDELLAGRDPKTLFESEGLLDELKKALAERVLNAEMDHHLGQDPEQAAGNHRNGSSSKTVLTDSGKLELSIPRDRHARFDPQLIAKYQRRFPGFDQKVIALYARGMSTREIQAHLCELYGVERELERSDPGYKCVPPLLGGPPSAAISPGSGTRALEFSPTRSRWPSYAK